MADFWTELGDELEETFSDKSDTKGSQPGKAVAAVLTLGASLVAEALGDAAFDPADFKVPYNLAPETSKRDAAYVVASALAFWVCSNDGGARPKKLPAGLPLGVWCDGTKCKAHGGKVSELWWYPDDEKLRPVKLTGQASPDQSGSGGSRPESALRNDVNWELEKRYGVDAGSILDLGQSETNKVAIAVCGVLAVVIGIVCPPVGALAGVAVGVAAKGEAALDKRERTALDAWNAFVKAGGGKRYAGASWDETEAAGQAATATMTVNTAGKAASATMSVAADGEISEDDAVALAGDALVAGADSLAAGDPLASAGEALASAGAGLGAAASLVALLSSGAALAELVKAALLYGVDAVGIDVVRHLLADGVPAADIPVTVRPVLVALNTALAASSVSPRSFVPGANMPPPDGKDHSTSARRVVLGK